MKQKNEKLNDSINVPVPRSLKKLIVGFAKQHPEQPSHTRFARMILAKAARDAAEKGLDSLGLEVIAAPAAGAK